MHTSPLFTPGHGWWSAGTRAAAPPCAPAPLRPAAPGGVSGLHVSLRKYRRGARRVRALTQRARATHVVNIRSVSRRFPVDGRDAAPVSAQQPDTRRRTRSIGRLHQRRGQQRVQRGAIFFAHKLAHRTPAQPAVSEQATHSAAQRRAKPSRCGWQLAKTSGGKPDEHAPAHGLRAKAGARRHRGAGPHEAAFSARYREAIERALQQRVQRHALGRRTSVRHGCCHSARLVEGALPGCGGRRRGHAFLGTRNPADAEH